MQLILASQSPRRRELLAAAGYEFNTQVPDGEESCPREGELPVDLVARLGREKAALVAAVVDNGIVIGCDTVADCDGQILGKPTDRVHAEQMLRMLSGRDHQVHSGLCLWRRPEDEVIVKVDTTRLRMAELSEEGLQDYLNSDLWVGKAGAFGYQDRLGWLQIVEGSESNVVGLPMELLQTMLADMMAE